MNTVILFLNGKPAGRIQFMPDGTPLVSSDSWGVLNRFPVPVFPFLDPKHFKRILLGLPRDYNVPGLGNLHTEVL